MRETTHKRAIALLGITILAFSLLSTFTAVNIASTSLLDFTPTAYVYLPVVANRFVPPDDLAKEQAILARINQERQAQGLPSLTLVSELTQSARRHSRDMADRNFTSHTGSDGSSPGERVAEAGYSGTYDGEIIAWGFGGDAQWVVDAWMNSPPHRARILSSDATDFGAGYAYNPNSNWGHYWTVNFGRSALQGDAESQDPSVLVEQ
jgi:uncharacterized protein YkwD